MTINEIFKTSLKNKQQKQISETINTMLEMVDNDFDIKFVEAGYKSFNDFVLESELILDSSTWKNTWSEQKIYNMMSCKNFDDFFASYDAIAKFAYFPLHTVAGNKKRMVLDKLYKDVKNYEELTDYFIFTVYQHIHIIEACSHDNVLLNQAISRVVNEWYSSELINGSHLLIDIHGRGEVANTLGAFFDYLEEKNKEKSFSSSALELHRYLSNILQCLDKQKRSILSYLSSLEREEMSFYRKPNNNAIFFVENKEKCYLNWQGLDSVLLKTETISEKLLQLFLHEYGKYILTAHHRNNLSFDLAKWDQFYEELLVDSDINSLLNAVHLEYGFNHVITFSQGGYADLFQIYYHNLFRNKRDTFSELNSDKEFLPQLIQFLSGHSQGENND